MLARERGIPSPSLLVSLSVSVSVSTPLEKLCIYSIFNWLTLTSVAMFTVYDTVLYVFSCAKAA